MPKILEKVERRLGEKLFLKGDRCIGPKCAAARRSYPPGVHGKKRSRGGGRGSSEFASLLREKQKVHFFYGLDDRDIKQYAQKASAKTGIFSDVFLRMMESRLDTVVWRTGLADSRRSSRQAVVHGHIWVNGKMVRSPGYATRQGDVIALKPRQNKSGIASSAAERIKHHTPPAWIALDRERGTGTITGAPDAGAIGMTFDITKIREFYSR